MSLNLWFDGHLGPQDRLAAPLTTHAMHYGTAVFEGIRSYATPDGAAVFRLPEHLQRMRQGADAFGAAFEVEEAAAAVIAVLRSNRHRDAYVRPLLWYGTGSLGLDVAPLTTHLMVASLPWKPHLGDKPVRLTVSPFRRNKADAMPPLKLSGAYVNSILAKREAGSRGFDDALFVDDAGFVCECTGVNVFIVQRGVVTAVEHPDALPGITRATVAELAGAASRPVTLEELLDADEVFLTGTSAEVLPVAALDRRDWGATPIADAIRARYLRVVRGGSPEHARWLTPDLSEDDVGVADVLAAHARLRRYLPPTPLHYAERFGTWLKLENLQRTGSYKVRGALNALLAARERGDRRPVIAASAGNHAQGLAWAAHRLGMQAITVMPESAPQTKIAGVAHWGATVRLHGSSFDEARAFALELAAQHGYRFLSAFDDPDVIAGQGTVGLELAAHAPDVVIVPIGGGGLASGVALALKAQGVRIVGAQPEGVDAMARVLRGDHSAPLPGPTLADGVRVRHPGLITRRLLATLLDDLVIVREAELRETLVRLALEEHVIAEGAGALALAAGRRVAGRNKCAVVSGGNIDAAVLAGLLSDVRPRAPRKPRRRQQARPAATLPPATPAFRLPTPALAQECTP